MLDKKPFPTPEFQLPTQRPPLLSSCPLHQSLLPSSSTCPSPESGEDSLLDQRPRQHPEIQVEQLPVDSSPLSQSPQLLLSTMSQMPSWAEASPQPEATLATRSLRNNWGGDPLLNYRPQWPEDQGGNKNQGTKHSSNKDKLRNKHLDI